MQLVSLYFGRGIAGRPDLTDGEWRRFVDQVITPALPLGFTAFDAEGAWMGPSSRRTIHERSKVLIAALPAGDGLAAVQHIRDGYQRAFHQMLVGMTVQPACGDF